MTRTIRRPLALCASTLLALGVTAVAATPANAASFTAGTSAELVQAITDANASVGADTITLTADILLAADLPIITTDLTIVGGGFEIDGASNLYNVFDTVAGTTVAITDLQIVAPAGYGIDAVGTSLTVSGVDIVDPAAEGIYFSGTTLSVTDSSISGAGSFGIEFSVSGSATVSGLEITDSAQRPLDATIGGTATLSIVGLTATGSGDVAYIVVNDTATAYIGESEFTQSDADGLYVFADGSASVEVRDSDSSDNDGEGFDFDVEDTATIIGAGLTAEGNMNAGVYVGARDASGVYLTDVESSDNGWAGVGADLYGARLDLTEVFATGNEDGVEVTAHTDESLVQIMTSTFDANDSGINLYLHDDDDTDGDPASASIGRTTVSGNDIGIDVELMDQTSLLVFNSTVSGNGVTEVPGILVEGESDTAVSIELTTVTANIGMGAVVIEGPAASVTNSILGGNDVDFDDLNYDGDDLTVSHSLVEIIDSAATQAAVDAGAGNITETTPLLGALADNGGPTLTHLPQAGSPVINAGDPALAGFVEDQRGELRVIGGRVDLGSVEVQAGAAPTLASTGADAPGGALLAGGALLGLGLLLGAASIIRRRSA